MEKFFKDLLDNGLDVLKRFNDFKGRTSRKEFWKFIIAGVIVGIALAILSAIPFLGKLFGIVSSLYQLAIVFLSLSVGIRRLHDVNKSGKLMIPYLIGLVPLIILMFVMENFARRVTVNPYDYLAGYTSSLSMIYVYGTLSTLFGIISLVGVIILAIYWFREGDPGANKYGPKPKA
jgi:uncharacterized membrane protein YhaH (DUF805 family)